MKRLLRIATIAFMCGVLVAPMAEAQGRRDGNRRERTEQRGGSNSHRSSAKRNSDSRESSRKSSRNKSSRSDRGDNNRRENDRRENDRRGNERQHQGSANNRHRPDNNRAQGRQHQPRHGSHYRPQGPRPVHVAPPHRPHRPQIRAYHRPTPPPSFRPHRGCPVINSILGLTFGSAINASLDYLFYHGYTVDGYGNDVVYLRNVNQLSLMWPDAMLYYGASGLYGSRFSYSTRYYDRTRYNQVYSVFVGRYGAPVRYEAVNNGFSATWFGYDGGYISLDYAPGYASDGTRRYFTTVSFGL